MLELYGADMTVLLRVVVVLGRVSGAAVVATGAGAEGFFSREVGVGTGVVVKSRVFGYFPVRIVPEVVVIIRKGQW